MMGMQRMQLFKHASPSGTLVAWQHAMMEKHCLQHFQVEYDEYAPKCSPLRLAVRLEASRLQHDL